MKIAFPQIYGHYYVVMENGKNNCKMQIDFPAKVQILGGKNIRVRYDSVLEQQGSYLAEAAVRLNEEYELRLVDLWSMHENEQIKLDRKVECVRSARKEGIRVTTEFRIEDREARSFDDYQIIFPGAFYNKNDTDEDGMDDYLGTFEQDYKDDRNPGLSETVWCSQSHNYTALIRADVPLNDEMITREQIKERHFLLDTEIGSLGFSPSVCKVNEMILRCDYPFYERNSFCLNVDASEWSGYKKMETGDSFEVSYLLVTGQAEDRRRQAGRSQSYRWTESWRRMLLFRLPWKNLWNAGER